MSTRVEKYYKEENDIKTSRTARNQNIYKEINNVEFEDVNLSSNVSVIEAPVEDLDIDKIKEILDEKYQKKAKKRVTIEDVDLEEGLEEIEDTKEYDLKKVLETAHKNKESDYDHERFKKLRETQYDILKSLDVERKEDAPIEENLTVEEANLMNLIKTVNFNAEKNKLQKELAKSEDDLEDELFGDLKGDGTEVLKPIDFEDDTEPDKKPTLVEELEKTKQLSRKDLEEELEKVEEKLESEEDEEEFTEERELSKTEELANTFYTGKYQISDKDLDDFKDLDDNGNVVVKILIIVIVIIVLAVGVYLLNKYLNLGLF